MAETRQSSMQRIQVGLIGLVVVLLFVSLANMVLDRVADAPAVAEVAGSDVSAEPKDAVGDEPLAELGVTPVAPENAPTDRQTSDGTTVPTAQPSPPR